MKKLLLAGLLILSGYWVFSEDEEIDNLLFLPNSSNQFVNEAEAAKQLNDTARYLINRNPGPGQVLVYGYTADVANDIDSVSLSRDRALFVINELYKRGLPREVFAVPVGHGSVNTWGDNSDEKDISLNRRVRIIYNDAILTPKITRNVESWIAPASPKTSAEPRLKFPWWLLSLALLAATAAILYITLSKDESAPVVTVPPKASGAVPVAAKDKIKILEKEEISDYANKLFMQRGCQPGYEAIDWDQSVRELTAFYEKRGYQVLMYWEIPEIQSQTIT
jgi:hypothetical protein